MSHANWVCFGCRRGVRRDTFDVESVACSECGGPCVCLGRKAEVPKRRDLRA